MRLGSSNSYNVQQTEAIESSSTSSIVEKSTTPVSPMTSGPLNNHIKCFVSFLDGSHFSFVIEKNALGNVLLEKVYSYLELIEKDYFGLIFFVADPSEGQRKKWLDPNKVVRKQMFCPPYHLLFRVKFYVNDPNKLKEEYTRYHFFLQVRLSILEGHLPCNEGSLALLASYAVQSECGDYKEKDHGNAKTCGCYKLKFAPRQPDDFASRVAELHQLHIGQSPADAEFNFLDHSRRLEMYGMDLYDGRDANGLPIEIGVGCVGIKVFHDGMKMSEYVWSRIMKLSFRKKQFLVQVSGEQPNADVMIVFNICSPKSCKQLWKCCIEQHTFFRLKTPPKPQPRRLFNIGSKFRYSGRTEYQTMEEAENKRHLTHRTFHRSLSKNSFARSTYAGPAPSIDSSRYTTTTSGSPELPTSGQLMARRLLRHETENSEGLGYTSDGVLGTPVSPRQTRDYCTDRSRVSAACHFCCGSPDPATAGEFLGS
ncbi:unnamed protein product [Caenorhabditis bovis]|uniref:Moesin/ezrin/radixin homolog 1 n=1 Tax=Caenorhabditis bovis TaxID=2654633 RepID=A0A8S1EQ78_9PELO|nr:unnamed protein product [Caenorhabditis bovis]